MRSFLEAWHTRRRVKAVTIGAVAVLAGAIIGLSQRGGDEAEPEKLPQVPQSTVGGVSDGDRIAFVQLITASRALEGLASQLGSVAPAQRNLVVQQLRPTALNVSLLRPEAAALRRVRATLLKALNEAMKAGKRDSTRTATRLRETSRRAVDSLRAYARSKPALQPLVQGR